MNRLCKGYRSFFLHIDQPMRIMMVLLGQNRAPAEIMHIDNIEKNKNINLETYY